jgi:hypothetical protein
MGPKAARSLAALGELEGVQDRANEQRAGRVASRVSSSLSDGRALMRFDGDMSAVVDNRFEWAGSCEKLRERQPGWEEGILKFDGRIGEVTTATRSARADATQTPWSKTFRLDIDFRISGPTNTSDYKDGRSCLSTLIIGGRPVSRSSGEEKKSRYIPTYQGTFYFIWAFLGLPRSLRVDSRASCRTQSSDP